MKPITHFSPTAYIAIFMMATFFASPLIAQPHSSGVDALADLRGAHWLIAQRPDGSQANPDDIAAMHAIEIAVQQLISRDIDDGKYYKDRPDLPNIDMTGMGPRLNRAVQLLSEAKTNIDKEDAPAIQSIKAKIDYHINDAIGQIEKTVASK